MLYIVIRIKIILIYMKKAIFNDSKIFIQNLDPNQDQILYSLLKVPLYLFIPAWLLWIFTMMLNEGFSLEILKTTAIFPLLLFAVAMTYYIFAFIPAYLFQLFLQKYNFINFFSIIANALILTTLILSLMCLEFAPIEMIVLFSYFSVIFAITYWVLLLRTIKKAAKQSNPKFPN
ncbi:hypothetical protein [uncultured Acinetobacter sp.]|uniref:hypothetical protein n=1 Tax=uncultured Acinetobacter sp. TaxID=165433 RepID=UPI00258F331B|nr:hypothetical protein [uncultured Acinetobacter sp.]